MDLLFFALWFFLPAGIANAAPILAANLPVSRHWNAPMDMGHTWRGKRLLGEHKTWRGLFSGIFAATIVVYLQQAAVQNGLPAFLTEGTADYLYYSPFLLGFLFGAGALLGDAFESLIKRQRNIADGEAWFPFDQIDYILGGCLALALVARLSAVEYIAVIATWFFMHLIFSYAGYKLGLKPKPI